MKRMMLTLTDEQFAALESLMGDNLQNNRTAFIAGLIGAEYRRVNKPETRGRPRKVYIPSDDTSDFELEPDYSNDYPKIHIHMGTMVGPLEWKAICERSKMFQPKN